ncbi:MAG: hypothetical protein ACRCY3_07920 [Sphingorhabdus sp.]
MNHKLIYYFMLSLTVALAFRFGARSERQGAVIAMVGSIASTFITRQDRWDSLDLRLLTIDLMVLAGFWWLSLKSDRYWPYWLTGWQLVAVILHIQRGLFEDILPAPYALLSMYLAYPMLAVILVASIRSPQNGMRTAA